jgi:HAD superfamily hydrolase (TIGR01509 family)
VRDGLRFLLFDLDGTLIVPGTDFKAMREDVKALFVEAGVPADLPFRHILGGTEDACAWLVEHGRDPAEVQELKRGAYAFVEAREWEGLARAREIPGVRTALQAWRGRYKLGIFTRTHPDVLRESIAKFDLGPFDVLLSRADGPPKPDPAQCRLALERAGVQAHEALAVGDHAFDVHSARGAGVRCVGVLTGSMTRAELEAAGADFILGSVADLRAHLG